MSYCDLRSFGAFGDAHANNSVTTSYLRSKVYCLMTVSGWNVDVPTVRSVKMTAQNPVRKAFRPTMTLVVTLPGPSVSDLTRSAIVDPELTAGHKQSQHRVQ